MKNSIIEQESDDGFTQTSDEYKRKSRKGDPRMNAAVHVKHVDPSISRPSRCSSPWWLQISSI